MKHGKQQQKLTVGSFEKTCFDLKGSTASVFYVLCPHTYMQYDLTVDPCF